jgi:hypothetical protein
MSYDAREERITFMNSMQHATNILIHNSKGETVDPREVIKLARKLAFISLNPQVDKVREEIQQ